MFLPVVSILTCSRAISVDSETLRKVYKYTREIMRLARDTGVKTGARVGMALVTHLRRNNLCLDITSGFVFDGWQNAKHFRRRETEPKNYSFPTNRIFLLNQLWIKSEIITNWDVGFSWSDPISDRAYFRLS